MISLNHICGHTTCYINTDEFCMLGIGCAPSIIRLPDILTDLQGRGEGDNHCDDKT